MSNCGSMTSEPVARAAVTAIEQRRAVQRSGSARSIDSGASEVKTIAEAWAMAFADYRRRQAERSLLAPLGLNLETYRRESPESRASLDDELRRWELEEAAIITGLDGTGAHLYTVSDPGWASCEDEVRLAASRRRKTAGRTRSRAKQPN